MYRAEGDCFNVPSTKACRDSAVRHSHSLHSVAIALLEQPAAGTFACMHMRKTHIRSQILYHPSDQQNGIWWTCSSTFHAAGVQGPQEHTSSASLCAKCGALVCLLLIQCLQACIAPPNARQISPLILVYHKKQAVIFAPLHSILQSVG